MMLFKAKLAAMFVLGMGFELLFGHFRPKESDDKFDVFDDEED